MDITKEQLFIVEKECPNLYKLFEDFAKRVHAAKIEQEIKNLS